MLSSTVIRIVRSLTRPIKSSLIPPLLPSSSHVHLSLPLHLHIKLLYLPDQFFMNLLNFLCLNNRSHWLWRRFYLLKHFVHPFSNSVHVIWVHLCFSFGNNLLEQIRQFLKLWVHQNMVLFQLIDKRYKLFHFLIDLFLLMCEILKLDVGWFLKTKVEPVLLRLKIRFDLVGLFFRNVFWVGADDVLKSVFVFVNERLKLIFLFVELFNFKVSDSHLLLLCLHLGKLDLCKSREVIQVVDLKLCLTVEWLDALESDNATLVETNLKSYFVIFWFWFFIHLWLFIWFFSWSCITFDHTLEQSFF